MATLKFQNKYQVTFNKLVKEGKDNGGIPDCIEVFAKEGWDILNEIRVVGERGFKVVAGEYDPSFRLRSTAKKFESKEAADLINRWFRREFEIFFKYPPTNEEIPVKVIREPKKITGKVEPKKVDKSTDKDDTQK